MQLSISYAKAFIIALDVLQVPHRLGPKALSGLGWSEATIQLRALPGLEVSTRGLSTTTLRHGIVDAVIQQDGASRCRITVTGRTNPHSSNSSKVFVATIEVPENDGRPVMATWDSKPSVKIREGVAKEMRPLVDAAVQRISQIEAPTIKGERLQAPTRDYAELLARA